MKRLKDLEWKLIDDSDSAINQVREGWITLDLSEVNQRIIKVNPDNLKPMMILSGEVEVRQMGHSLTPGIVFPLVILDDSKAIYVDVEKEMDEQV